jgi:hypothetical protein
MLPAGRVFLEQKVLKVVKGYALSKSNKRKSPRNSRQKRRKRESDLKGKSNVLSGTIPAVVLEQTWEVACGPAFAIRQTEDVLPFDKKDRTTAG